MHAKSLKSSLILGNPMDCSLPGSSVHGILQARILKWVAMPSSTESKYFLACDKLKFCFLELSHFSCSVVSNSLQPHVLQHARLPCRSLSPWVCSTHVHWDGDAITVQAPCPLSPPSPPALNLPKHQGPFQWVNSLPQVAKVSELHLQHHSFW